MQISKITIAQGRVYRVLAFLFGDVGKNFIIECRYSHLRFRRFVVPLR